MRAAELGTTDVSVTGLVGRSQGRSYVKVLQHREIAGVHFARMLPSAAKRSLAGRPAWQWTAKHARYTGSFVSVLRAAHGVQDYWRVVDASADSWRAR